MLIDDQHRRKKNPTRPPLRRPVNAPLHHHQMFQTLMRSEPETFRVFCFSNRLDVLVAEL